VEPKLEEVRKWAKDGLSDKRIASNLGIAYSTFREYKKKYSALSAPLKEGKNCAVKQVENALFKKALGYDYEEVTKELSTNEETGKQELKITKVVTKRVHPDTTAIIFYLKNRMPDKWRSDPHKVKMDEAILELRKKELELKEW
ncbi:hypothetical protein PN594_19055, partial [Parabacteroides merdae]|nr:hypothetical protein [Parabacteroides merdae]